MPYEKPALRKWSTQRVVLLGGIALAHLVLIYGLAFWAPSIVKLPVQFMEVSWLGEGKPAENKEANQAEGKVEAVLTMPAGTPLGSK